MNIIINEVSHKLVKTEETDNYIEYDVYRADSLLGSITKTGIEICYTGRDTEGNIKATAATLRDTLEAMILNIFYRHTYNGDRYMVTLGTWLEGSTVEVEYTKNDVVKHAKRLVRYNAAAGDLYIVLDNRKYFLYEFD